MQTMSSSLSISCTASSALAKVIHIVEVAQRFSLSLSLCLTVSTTVSFASVDFRSSDWPRWWCLLGSASAASLTFLLSFSSSFLSFLFASVSSSLFFRFFFCRSVDFPSRHWARWWCLRGSAGAASLGLFVFAPLLHLFSSPVLSWLVLLCRFIFRWSIILCFSDWPRWWCLLGSASWTSPPLFSFLSVPRFHFRLPCSLLSSLAGSSSGDQSTMPLSLILLTTPTGKSELNFASPLLPSCPLLFTFCFSTSLSFRLCQVPRLATSRLLLLWLTSQTMPTGKWEHNFCWLLHHCFRVWMQIAKKQTRWGRRGGRKEGTKKERKENDDADWDLRQA